MDARELRIGNIIDLHIETADRWVNNRVVSSNDIDCIANGAMAHGIPLTQEWLDRLGFKKYSDGKYLIWHQDFTYHIKERSLNGFKDGGYFMGIRFDDFDPDPETVYIFEASKGNVKYVHQLQNLYFALTGQELTLKP